jgi:hypothetical protein
MKDSGSLLNLGLGTQPTMEAIATIFLTTTHTLSGHNTPIKP